MITKLMLLSCPSSSRSNHHSSEVKKLKRKLQSLQQTNEQLEACLLSQTRTFVEQGRERDELEDTVRSLQQTKERLETCIHSQTTTLVVRSREKDELQDKVDLLQRRISEMEKENEDLLQKLKSHPDTNNVPFDGNYFFDKQNVVRLSQLISRHLDNKPSTIDSSIIYTCINKIVMELKNGSPEKLPFNYRRNVQMLLNTCLLTGNVIFQTPWFTPMQMINIECWYKEFFEINNNNSNNNNNNANGMPSLTPLFGNLRLDHPHNKSSLVEFSKRQILERENTLGVTKFVLRL